MIRDLIIIAFYGDSWIRSDEAGGSILVFQGKDFELKVDSLKKELNGILGPMYMASLNATIQRLKPRIRMSEPGVPKSDRCTVALR